MKGVPDAAGGAAAAAADGEQKALSLMAYQQRVMAPRRHGLYAKSSHETRQRSYRAGRLLHRLEVVLEEQGRALTEEQIPAARAWAELGVVADQVYEVLMQSFRKGEVPSPKLLDSWRGLQRDRLLHAQAIGLTPMGKAQLAEAMGTLEAMRRREVEAIQERLRQKYGRRVDAQ